MLSSKVFRKPLKLSKWFLFFHGVFYTYCKFNCDHRQVSTPAKWNSKKIFLLKDSFEKTVTKKYQKMLWVFFIHDYLLYYLVYSIFIYFFQHLPRFSDALIHLKLLYHPNPYYSQHLLKKIIDPLALPHPNKSYIETQKKIKDFYGTRNIF